MRRLGCRRARRGAQRTVRLLFAQLAGVLLYPFMEGRDVGRALFSVFGIAILGLVLLAVRSTPALTWVACCSASRRRCCCWSRRSPARRLLPYSSAFEAVLYFYAAGALIAYMLADHEVTRDELFAVGATFTLVAWAFAYLYVVCQAIEPHSFTAAVNPAASAPGWSCCSSASRRCRARPERRRPDQAIRPPVAMIEQLAGLAYVAMVVSRLVALTVVQRR